MASVLLIPRRLQYRSSVEMSSPLNLIPAVLSRAPGARGGRPGPLFPVTLFSASIMLTFLS